MADNPQVLTKLPENAYRELRPGEQYVPMVPPTAQVPEVTLRSILFGLLMNVIFSMAATYIALKIGSGIETAIPISILAVGFSGMLVKFFGARRSSLIENMNILAISTTSGIVAGGTVFTMPAIYVLKLNEKLNISDGQLFLQIFLVPFLGAILGVLFLVPFRRYFVKQMHGKLPFPEATATNEILVTGSAGSGSQAMVLVYSFLVGGLFNWLGGAMKLFTEVFTTASITSLSKLTNNVKAVFSLGIGAEFLGMGFIIGVRYASIICAGSLLSWFVITPLLGPLDLEHLQRLNPTCVAHQGQDEASPRFSLPAAIGTRIDAWDELRSAGAKTAPNGKDQQGQSAPGAAELTTPQPTQREALLAELRQTLQSEFSRNNLALLDKKPSITVVKKGEKWTIKDTKRTYTLKVEQGTIQVFARTPNADDIFGRIPKNIGIGCIVIAGLLSILKMSKVIVTALHEALGALFRSRNNGGAVVERTDEDISYPTLVLIGLVTTVVMGFYFRFVALADMPNAMSLTLISVVLALVVAFLFTTVSAWAIATISTTPISGMTVTTIILTAVILLGCGLSKGESGMLAVLLVGGVVAGCLSMAGTLVTEFKIAYWTGATPKKIQWSAILASLLASALVTATIMIVAKAPGYDPDVTKEALRAPQANMMASALQSFIGTGEVPWLMYGTGAVMALLLQLLNISPLAFGLGMYLPMELNIPVLLGAFVSHLVYRGAPSNPEKDPAGAALNKARSDKGILVASGLIAGAAVIGVVKSLLSAFAPDTLKSLDYGHVYDKFTSPEAASNWAGLLVFLFLCALVYFDCRRAKPAKE